MPASLLEDRYRRKTRPKLNLILIVSGLVLATLAVGLFFVFWQLPKFDRPITFQTLESQTENPNKVAVSYRLTYPADTRVSCVVRALAEDFIPVGWKVVNFPRALQPQTLNGTTVLRTTRLAVHGEVHGCWED